MLFLSLTIPTSRPCVHLLPLTGIAFLVARIASSAPSASRVLIIHIATKGSASPEHTRYFSSTKSIAFLLTLHRCKGKRLGNKIIEPYSSLGLTPLKTLRIPHPPSKHVKHATTNSA